MFDFWLGCWYRVCTSEPFKNMKPDGLQTFLNGRLVQSLQLHLRNGHSCIGARLQAITGVGSALKGMRGHGCPEATRATRAQDCSHKWAAAIQRFNGSLDGAYSSIQISYVMVWNWWVLISSHFFPAEEIPLALATEKIVRNRYSTGSDLLMGIPKNKLRLRNFLRNHERFRMVS